MSPEAPIAAPIIVSAQFSGPDQAWLDDLRRAHFPPERNHLAAHLTLFHHLPPSLAGELHDRLTRLVRRAPPPARIGGLVNLGRGVAIRIDSADLVAIRAELAETFAPLLTPQDQAGWRPHVTIQNKVRPEQARALLTELAPVIPDRPIAIAALAAYWYRGGPWELIARHPFRGSGRG